MSKDYPWGKGTPAWVVDATLNDSDKSWTVPAGKVRVYNYIFAYLQTTATVGNRVMRVSITDGTTEIFRFSADNLAASLTGRFCWFVGGIDDPAASVDSHCAFPELCLLPGYVIRVYDSAAIDAAADDLTVALHYVEYDA